MFTQAWFWISLSAFFFNSNFSYHKSKGALNGSAIARQDSVAAISMIGIMVFWIIGLFVADHWWQPIATFGISLVGGSVMGALIDAILPRGLAIFIGAMSPFISFALAVASYLVWY